VLVVVTFMVVVMIVSVGAFVCGFKGPLGRVRLRGSFEGVGRAQRFAFQARRGEPNKLPGPDCRIGLKNPCGLEWPNNK
jgi:hypothetical protein